MTDMKTYTAGWDDGFKAGLNFARMMCQFSDEKMNELGKLFRDAETEERNKSAKKAQAKND